MGAAGGKAQFVAGPQRDRRDVTTSESTGADQRPAPGSSLDQ